MLRAALVALLALMLVACGGGGGGGSASQPSSSPPPVPRTDKVRVGYFGVDGNQIGETADHASYVFAPDWSEQYWATPDGSLAIETRIITQLQEAKQRGIKEAWVSIGFLLFDATPDNCSLWRYTPRPDAIARLHAFKQHLEALGLLDGFVTTLYPVDEPDLHCLSDAQLSSLLSAVKAEWPAYLAVIYADRNSYPGLRFYDLIGKDKYDAGSGVLNEMPPITPLQHYLLVPGGASGLSGRGPDDPRPFCEYARDHANVYAIVTFVWFDRGADRGVRSNGMAPAYKSMALSLQQSNSCPP